MRERIITLAILPLICSITAILAIVNKSDNYLSTKFYITSDLARIDYYWVSNSVKTTYYFELVIAAATGGCSFIYSCVHLLANKEPIRGMNIAIAIQGILIFTMVNWIFCIIALRKLSWHKKAEQQTKV